MVLNFYIIFSNEVAKYQNKIKENDEWKIMYFGSFILIRKVFVY